MIFLKGGAVTENTVLFGKYRVDRRIGSGRNGTVFLVKHLMLGEYRAVKRVPKDGRDEQSLLREAMILKSLKHPGIPVIYDLEQDASYYYLIEEYLDGESLFTLVSKQGNLSRSKTISYGIELCQIIYYLHSLKPTPILYLDLQPNNILICDGRLNLIDFDQAVSAILTGSLRKRYGTAGFAAPEQYSNAPLDMRTDIYAIGALLHYMMMGTSPGSDADALKGKAGNALAEIIIRCLRPSMEDRYLDVEAVLTDLLKLKPGVFSDNQISLLKIAVTCSSHGMGATHVSLGLSSYLSQKGIKTLYEECNSRKAAGGLVSAFGIKPDKYGIFHLKNLDIKPGYGTSVRLDMPFCEVIVEDWGTNLEVLCDSEKYDLILLLCGGKWWELYDSFKAVRLLSGEKNLRIIFNHSSPKKIPFSFEWGSTQDFYRIPYFPEYDNQDIQMLEFWSELLRETTIGRRLAEAEIGYGRRGGRTLLQWLGYFLKKPGR